MSVRLPNFHNKYALIDRSIEPLAIRCPAGSNRAAKTSPLCPRSFQPRSTGSCDADGINLPVSSMIGACRPLVRGTYRTSASAGLPSCSYSAQVPQSMIKNHFIYTHSLYEGPIGSIGVRRGNSLTIAQIYAGLLTLHKLGGAEGIRGETLFGGHFCYCVGI